MEHRNDYEKVGSDFQIGLKVNGDSYEDIGSNDML